MPCLAFWLEGYTGYSFLLGTAAPVHPRSLAVTLNILQGAYKFLNDARIKECNTRHRGAILSGLGEYSDPNYTSKPQKPLPYAPPLRLHTVPNFDGDANTSLPHPTDSTSGVLGRVSSGSEFTGVVRLASGTNLGHNPSVRLAGCSHASTRTRGLKADNYPTRSCR